MIEVYCGSKKPKIVITRMGNQISAIKEDGTAVDSGCGYLLCMDRYSKRLECNSSVGEDVQEALGRELFKDNKLTPEGVLKVLTAMAFKDC